MEYIEFEKSIKNQEWSMTDLHSHNYYELYFLISGTRSFFLKDRMYKISGPCFIVIPPYSMHKTEGFGFTRININVSKELLNQYELFVLKNLSEKVIQLSSLEFENIFAILDEAQKQSSKDNKYMKDILKAYLSYLIVLIDNINNYTDISAITTKSEKASPITLKIIDYISNHIEEDITLETLSKQFFISKVSICANFKKSMLCTVKDFIIKTRLNKAKQYLSSTKKSVEEISTLCGFSSGAYMGLIFKQRLGLSPLQYRKFENSKK